MKIAFSVRHEMTAVEAIAELARIARASHANISTEYIDTLETALINAYPTERNAYQKIPLIKALRKVEGGTLLRAKRKIEEVIRVIEENNF